MPTVTTLSGQILSVDLETRDFEGYRSDVLGSGGLADHYTPDWTDRSELDLGVALVEAFAFIGDNLSYYQDRCANEALWPSITQRRSIIEQSKLIGYELRPNTSASVNLTFVTNGAGTVPALTQVEVDISDGSSPATFELESDFVSTGAGTYAGNVALHGTTLVDDPWSSDGSADQQFVLSGSPLALTPDGVSSLEVWVTEGGPSEKWTEVDNFLDRSPSDKIYRIEIDEYDQTTVIFGDGVNGKVPISGVDNIQATYRVGGGTAGNQVGPNKLTKLVGSFTFVDSVTNPLQPSGGIAKESIEEAKENAPLSFQSGDRAVRHADYKALALEVPGVAKAYAYNTDAAPYDEYVVIAAGGSNPVPTGSWDPRTLDGDAGLIKEVGIYLEDRKTVPVRVFVRPVQVVDLYLSMTVYLLKTVRRSDAQRYIEDAVKAALNIENQTFGEQVPVSMIYDVVEGVTGVDYLDISRFQRVPYARHLTDGSATDVSFGSFVVGLNTTRDRWRVESRNTTEFLVWGENYGLQTNTGTLGVVYSPDDESFSFLASAGTVDPTDVDKWEIVTGPYLGNINPDEDELCRLFGDTFTLNLVGGVG